MAALSLLSLGSLLLVFPLVSCTIMLRKGDVEISVMLDVTQPKDETKCNKDDVRVPGVEIAQVFSYITDDINKNPYILRDTSTGFAVYDTCEKRDWTQMVTESILSGKRNKEMNEKISYVPTVVMYPAYLPSVDGLRTTLNNNKILNFELDFWGSSGRRSSRPNSHHFTFVAPQISVARAMKDLLVHYNWTYVSLVMSESASSFMAAEALNRELKEAGICIATQLRVPPGVTNPGVYQQIRRNLQRQARARVVMTFLNKNDTIGLSNAFNRTAEDKDFFIFLAFGSDTTILAHSGLVIQLKNRNTDGMAAFTKYYSSLTYENNRINPWFQKALDFYNDCTLKGLFGLGCEKTNHPVNIENRPLDVYYSTVKEAVWTYAAALDATMSESCLNRTTPGSQDSCLKSINETLFMKKVAEAYRGTNSFNVAQILAYSTEIRIGSWNKTLNISGDPDWKVLHLISRPDDPVTSTPVSVCSAPCLNGETAVYSRDRCCWICI